jgi:calcium-dependent protein kinase
LLFKFILYRYTADKSGTITINELQKGLAKKGAGATSSEITELMKSMDVDGSGELDYEEFIAATVGGACTSRIIS